MNCVSVSPTRCPKLQPIDTAIIGFGRLNVCIRYVILGMFFFGSAFYYNLRAQVKVYDDGRLEIYSQVGTWGKALKTTVTSPNACAYHLNYNNADVSYFCAQGWLWTKLGGYYGSDIKYKQEVSDISAPMDILQTIQGRRYYFKDDSTRLRYGFIGQELEKTHPEMVREVADGSLAVSYMDVIAILVECVKEQQKEIDELRKEIDSMKNK